VFAAGSLSGRFSYLTSSSCELLAPVGISGLWSVDSVQYNVCSKYII